MAKVRSPNYPNTDLGSALAMARKVYDKDNRNRIPQEAIARHLGHENMSGPALGKIAALRTYGLIDGPGDALRITEEAVAAMMAPAQSPERAKALGILAFKPGLFKEIRGDFPTTPSDDALRFWLAKKGYSPEASAKATKAYLATLALVPESAQAYDSGSTELEEEVEPVSAREALGERTMQRIGRQLDALTIRPEDTRQAVFPLTEGDVTITFPANMSADGFEELSDYLEIFLKRAAAQAAKTPKSDA